MDIHKSVPPRDWHVTTVTSVSRQARDGACGELSCQPRQEFHSKSHNASHALLLASLADGGFRTGQAHADVTSGTGALCGWQARGKDRKRNIEQKAARTEKQQQRNGRISKGAGLSSGDNGDINDNFVFHHYEDYHLHMQHYRYHHTVSHAGRACADLLHSDDTLQSTSGLNTAQEQSRKPAHTPARPAATATLPEIKTSKTTTTATATATTTITSITVSTTTPTTVTTPFVLARAPSCLTEALLLSCADVSLSQTPAPRAVTPPAILTSSPHRRGVSRSWSQSWGQYQKFCRLREALTHRQRRREAVRCRHVAHVPRAGDDKGDNVERDDNSDITKISQDKGEDGALLGMKKDFQKVMEEPVFGFANDLMQNSELRFYSTGDGRCQCQLLRCIVSQAKRQTAGDQSTPASPQHSPHPVDDARAVHPVSHTDKWDYQDCISFQHQNSPDNIWSIGLPEDSNVPETGSKNVSFEFAELTGYEGKSASGHSGSARTRENDLWIAGHGTHANRFSEINWFSKEKKRLGPKPSPDGTHDKNENPDKKLELELGSDKSASNRRSIICQIFQGDESATDDKQAALEKNASNPKKMVAAACNRWKHDGPIRKSAVKSVMRLSSTNISDCPVAAVTSGDAHPTLTNSTLIRCALERTASLPPRLCANKTHEVDACTNAEKLSSPIKARFILPNKHVVGASRKICSSTRKSLSTNPFISSPAVDKSVVPKALLHMPVKNGSSPSTGECSLPKLELNVRASYIVPGTTTSTPDPLLISPLCLHTPKTPMRSRSSLNFRLNSERRRLVLGAVKAPVVRRPLVLKSTPSLENSPRSGAICYFSLTPSRQTKTQRRPELGMESVIRRH